jgi:hypothetical protein
LCGVALTKPDKAKRKMRGTFLQVSRIFAGGGIIQ